MQTQKKYMIHRRFFKSNIWRFSIKGTRMRCFDSIEAALKYANLNYPSCCYDVQILDDTFKIVYSIPLGGVKQCQNF